MTELVRKRESFALRITVWPNEYFRSFSNYLKVKAKTVNFKWDVDLVQIGALFN